MIEPLESRLLMSAHHPAPSAPLLPSGAYASGSDDLEMQIRRTGTSLRGIAWVDGLSEADVKITGSESKKGVVTIRSLPYKNPPPLSSRVYFQLHGTVAVEQGYVVVNAEYAFWTIPNAGPGSFNAPGQWIADTIGPLVTGGPIKGSPGYP